MDIDNASQHDAQPGFELTNETKNLFKEWVKMRSSRPHDGHAQDWFRTNCSVDDVSVDYCSQLIHEAMDEAREAAAARAKIAKSIHVPGFAIPLGYMPPADQRFPVLVGVEGYDWKAATLLIREVCMLKFTEELTNKAEWWIKVQDPQITDKWKQEALQTNWEAYRQYADFTPAMADACISELRSKADLYQQTGLIPVFDYSSCVIKSDSLVPEELRSALRSAVSMLEDVPDGEKDWHPGTMHKVLNLVHPSLFPFVYGRTPVLLDKRIGISDALSHCGMGTVLPQPLPIETEGPGEEGGGGEGLSIPSLSNRFQWLPCDVVLDGASAKIDSYINNLHPVDHAHLYPLIERFVEKALPAWDIIYRWPAEFETQRITTTTAVSTCSTPEICRPHYSCQPWNRPLDEDEPQNDNAPYQQGYAESERFRRDIAWLNATHKIDLPDAVPGAEHHLRLSPSDVKSSGFFNGASRIQVIVKLANIQLTPEDPEFQFEASQELAEFYNAPQPEGLDRDSDVSSFHPASSEGSPSNSDVSSPGRRPLSLTYSDYHSVFAGDFPAEYDGGSWHTEGMLNERICATALFYYDSDNVTDCHLDFRTPSNREDFSVALHYEQSQHYPIARTFAIPNTNRDTLQHIGGVLTTNSPSTGSDDTRAVFFPNLLQHRVSSFRLADPSRPGHRKILALFLVDPAIPIVSTANVPPQQRHWWERETHIQERLAQRLPSELTRMVLDDLDDFPIDRDAAKKIRLELMDERSVKQDKTAEELSRYEWNFCEH